NAQLNGLFAFEAPLATAIRAAFLHDLSRAPAIRARPRDGEEPLGVGQLAAAAAGLAILNAGALLRAGSVAGFAKFLAGQLNLRCDARGSFFERKRHVIT